MVHDERGVFASALVMFTAVGQIHIRHLTSHTPKCNAVLLRVNLQPFQPQLQIQLSSELSIPRRAYANPQKGLGPGLMDMGVGDHAIFLNAENRVSERSRSRMIVAQIPA